MQYEYVVFMTMTMTMVGNPIVRQVHIEYQITSVNKFQIYVHVLLFNLDYVAGRKPHIRF